jgi:hypothetical protein
MRFICFILFTSLIISCHPPKKPSNIVPEGDEAIIHLNRGTIYRGELIAIRDSNIYIIKQGKIIPISLMEIKKVEIPGYNLDVGERIARALPSLAMQLIILLVAGDVGEQTWATVAGISMVATVFLYATAGTELKFSAPFSKDDIEQLRLYCRYPQELDTEVWLKIFHQRE